MRAFILSLGAVLAVESTIVAAQQPAKGVAVRVFAEASNKSEVSHWIEIESVTIERRDEASGQATGKRIHRPTRVRTTLPVGGALVTWPLGQFESDGGWPTSAMVSAKIDGSSCTFAVPIRRDAAGNAFNLELDGKAGGFFRRDGMLDPTRCGRP
jgi:hypothetical protein